MFVNVLISIKEQEEVALTINVKDYINDRDLYLSYISDESFNCMIYDVIKKAVDKTIGVDKWDSYCLEKIYWGVK